MVDPYSVATAFVAAIAYSFSHYLPKYGEEAWEPRKLVQTLVIGGLVAAYVVYAGIELTPTNLPHIASGIGAVALSQKIVQFLWRRLGLGRLIDGFLGRLPR